MPHSHPLAQGLYIASWVILLKFASEVLFATFPDQPAVQAAKQSL